MPKPTRPPEDVEAVRQQILAAAVEIICEQGFIALSMRKLAARLGMTAANIYNYFANQDELYLTIQRMGFEQLRERFRVIGEGDMAPLEKLNGIINCYLEFGFGNPGYYEIMMDINAPRYSDYVGTAVEDLAARAWQCATDCALITAGVIAGVTGEPISSPEVEYQTLKLWISVTGMVTLHNRRIWPDVRQSPDEVMRRMAAELLLPFK